MSRQLPLGLQLRSSTRLEDFVYGDDSPLLELLQQQLRSTGEPLIYLHGEHGCGRTHLLMGQCSEAQRMNLTVAYLPCSDIADLSPQVLESLEQLDLVAIDDVQLLAGRSDWETALFNLFNRARDSNCRLLIAADSPAARLPLSLADLRSRLGWGVSYRIKPLNDPQRRELIRSLAHRRGLQMPDQVARYLLERHSRDSHALTRLIERLDRDSLAEQRRLSIPFVRTRLN